MIRNYLNIAWRNLIKNKLFSLINIIGLAVGMSVSMLILLYVSHESSYDKFHPNANRIFQISQSFSFDGQTMNTTGMHQSLSTLVKQNIAEVKNSARFHQIYGEKVLKGDYVHTFKESKLYVGDPSVLRIFGFKLKSGNVERALIEPNKIVLTEQLAQKYFGNENPVGRSITYDTKYPMIVSGVIENPPSNSIFQFDAIISFSSLPKIEDMKEIYDKAGAWATYVVLDDVASKTKVEKKMVGVSRNLTFGGGDGNTYHLNSLVELSKESASQRYLYIFLSVALLILLLAIINYVSLTTARASHRAKEVGIRKASGGRRAELLLQFFLESFLTTILAFGLAIVLFKTFEPVALNALEIKIDESFLLNPIFIGISLGLFLICGVFSGIFPAVVLSRFSPYEVLRGQFNRGTKGTKVRRFLTTFQFAVSIILVVCSLLIVNQLEFIRNKEIGLHKDQVMVLPVDKTIARNLMAFKQEIRQQNSVENISFTDSPIFKTENATSMFFISLNDSKKEMGLNIMNVDANFFQTLGVKWKQIPSDWNGKVSRSRIKVFNETALREMNRKSAKVGEYLPLNMGKAEGILLEGVVQDFNFATLHEKIKPLMLNIVSDTTRNLESFSGDSYLFVRLNAKSNLAEDVANIQKIYKKYQPNIPFDFYFMDEAFDKLYRTEERMARMFGAFTGFAIFIACLGLFGLITFIAEQKIKEIGIRKVLGASVSSIIILLSKDLVRFVALANIIAFPIAYFLMDKWLQDFAYKMPVNYWVFAAAGAFSVLIAILTMSYQSIKAALMNPVKSLKSE
jgi:putative ABC transport system permease protein